MKNLRVAFLFLVISFVIGQLAWGAPETKYRDEWMREHWGVDSVPEENREGKQLGGLGDLGKVVDSVGKFDLREVNKFLKEIPELFESVNTIVDGAETSFGEGDS